MRWIHNVKFYRCFHCEFFVFEDVRYKKYIGKKVDLVTADGGFDYSKSYNSQEDNSYKLNYSEIFVALNIQKLRGNFSSSYLHHIINQ